MLMMCPCAASSCRSCYLVFGLFTNPRPTSAHQQLPEVSSENQQQQQRSDEKIGSDVPRTL